VFIFSTKLSTTSNRDSIVDFSVADDSLYLDNAIFTKLGSGSMSSPKKVSSSYFTVGSAAKDKNDHLIYDKATGASSYDADGSARARRWRCQAVQGARDDLQRPLHHLMRDGRRAPWLNERGAHPHDSVLPAAVAHRANLGIPFT
jgi:hypothetical protein